MTVSYFEQQLIDLRQDIIQMGGAVEEMLAAAVEALLREDLEKAKAAIKLDRAINAAEVRIVDQTILLIATNQPVAGDLRFLAAALRLAAELERVGDIAANVARRAIGLAAVPKPRPLPAELADMARLARKMIGDGALVHWGLEIIWASAHFERLGDHATNLAEEAIYIVTGRNVRHQCSTPSLGEARK